MSSLSATPLTVTFIAIGCGRAKSSLGSTSATSGSAPTLNVLSGLIPVAVRSRKSCRPSAASGAIRKTAVIWPSLLTSTFVAVIPG